MMSTEERNRQILAERAAVYAQQIGPRVGDFLRRGEHLLRFTHDWGDGIQTTSPKFGNGRFYLGEDYVSYSGALDASIPKTRLRPTDETRDGMFWFFSENEWRAHNAAYVMVECRVYIEQEDSDD